MAWSVQNSVPSLGTLHRGHAAYLLKNHQGSQIQSLGMQDVKCHGLGQDGFASVAAESAEWLECA